MHYRQDGCFRSSYQDGGFATTTVYYRNRCRSAHWLLIHWTGSSTERIRVGGKRKGSSSSIYGRAPWIEDGGRAR